MKITVIKSGIIDNTTFNQGIALVKECLPNFTINIRDTYTTFTGVSFANDAVGAGICVDPQQILNLVDGSEDIVFLIFDASKVTPQPTNPAQSPIKKGNCTPCQMPMQWYVTYPEVFRDYFLHEICHALYYLNGKVAQDLTHLLNNRNWNTALYDQWSSKPQFEYYMSIINSFKTPEMPSVTIERQKDDGIETLGILTAKNAGMTFTCKTLERPFKNNIANISASPTGMYQVKYTFSPRLLKYTYEIQNVVARTGIRIHSSNFVKQLLGCVALGETIADINGDKVLDITNSRKTIALFEQFMGKKSFTLTVK